MDALQEIILMIDRIEGISWDMQLLQELLSTKKYINFVILRSPSVWFGEYNSHISIEYKHTPGSLLLWQYPESHIHN